MARARQRTICRPPLAAGSEATSASTTSAETETEDDDEGDDDDVDEDGLPRNLEGGLDYNLIKNFLESFKSQGGLAGPVSSLAGRLQPGWGLPRDEAGL